MPSLVAIAEHFVDGYEKGEFFSRLGGLVGDAMIAVTRRVMVAVGALKAFGTLMSGVGRAAELLAGGNASASWAALQESFAAASSQVEAARVDGAKLVTTYNQLASQSTAAASGVNKLNAALKLGGGGGGRGRGNNEAERLAKAAEAARVAEQLARAMDLINGDDARADMNEWAQALRFALEEADFKRAADEA